MLEYAVFKLFKPGNKRKRVDVAQWDSKCAKDGSSSGRCQPQSVGSGAQRSREQVLADVEQGAPLEVVAHLVNALQST